MWDERDEQYVIFFWVFYTLSLHKKIKFAAMKSLLDGLGLTVLTALSFVVDFWFYVFPFRFSLRKRYYGQLSHSSSS